MAALRFKLLIPLFFLLQACAQQSWLPSVAASGCVPDAEKRISEADWTDPGRLSIRIRQGEFTPMVFGLTKNRPYEIEFENADDVSHVFQAPNFFRSVAFDKIVVDGEEIREICPRSLTIGPGKKLTAYLIPVRDGRYEFSDNTFNLPLGPLTGVSGSISIEERMVSLIRPPKSIPPYPEGIREFLNAPVRARVESGPAPQPGGLFDDTEQSPPAEPGGLFNDAEQSPPAEPGGLFNDVKEEPAATPVPPIDEAAPVPQIDEMFPDPLKEEPQQPVSPPAAAPAKDTPEQEPPTPAAPAPAPSPKPEAKKAPTLPTLEELLRDEPVTPFFPEEEGLDKTLPSLKELLGDEPQGPATKKGKGAGGLKASPPKAPPEKPKKKAVPKEKKQTQKEQEPDPFSDDLFKLPDGNTDGGGAGADDTLLEDSLRYLPYLGLGG